MEARSQLRHRPKVFNGLTVPTWICRLPYERADHVSATVYHGAGMHPSRLDGLLARRSLRTPTQSRTSHTGPVHTATRILFHSCEHDIARRDVVDAIINPFAVGRRGEPSRSFEQAGGKLRDARYAIGPQIEKL